MKAFIRHLFGNRSGTIRQTKTLTADAKGRMGEDLAHNHLQAQGYKTLVRRFCRRNGRSGEIDLVISRDDIVAFVEVKTYRQRNAALEAITPRVRQRIGDGARAWLAENPLYIHHTLRFDLVLVDTDGNVEHIPNAWGLE